MTQEKIDNWHGKPIGEMSRGELINALDWCVKQLRDERLIGEATGWDAAKRDTSKQLGLDGELTEKDLK